MKIVNKISQKFFQNKLNLRIINSKKKYRKNKTIKKNLIYMILDINK